MKIYEKTIDQVVLNLTIEGVHTFLWAVSIGLIIFLPLEIFFQAKKQGFFRFEWGTDLLFFAGQFFLWNALSVSCLIALGEWLQTMEWQPFRELIASQPYWLQFLEIIFLCDIFIYWAHRLSHQINFLWRFHKVHHTSETLDWMAAYREHPLDNIYTRIIENLPALLLGFPLETIAGFIVFRGLWGLFIHSNVNITMGPLAYIIGSPRLHHWHHDKRSGGKCNFANLSPLMDIMFGTYHNPGNEPINYGVLKDEPRNYFLQILLPCLPNPLSKKIQNSVTKKRCSSLTVDNSE